ncbi:hypothetical protein T484DRAFT_1926377 [Baffinella frigidus]|nr:hypothetical protein T484DRAFT_1926377 [Cryptophyta sp. CCMP2293]
MLVVGPLVVLVLVQLHPTLHFLQQPAAHVDPAVVIILGVPAHLVWVRRQVLHPFDEAERAPGHHVRVAGVGRTALL